MNVPVQQDHEYHLKHHVRGTPVHRYNLVDTLMSRHGRFVPHDVRVARRLAREYLANGLNPETAEAFMGALEAKGIHIHFDDGRERRDGKAAFSLHGYRIGPRVTLDTDTSIALNDIERVRNMPDSDHTYANGTADARNAGRVDQIVYELQHDGEGNVSARARQAVQRLYPTTGEQLLAQNERYQHAVQREHQTALAAANTAIAAQTTQVAYQPQKPDPSSPFYPTQLMDAYYARQAEKQAAREARRHRSV